MIFVDTGAFIARDLEGADPEQAALAERGWQELPFGITTDLVLAEVVSFMKRKGAPEAASIRAESIIEAITVQLTPITPADRETALAFFRKFQDQPTVSWCDCVSFAVMKRQKIGQAFSFDGDFELAGFELWPDPSFRPRCAKGAPKRRKRRR